MPQNTVLTPDTDIPDRFTQQLIATFFLLVAVGDADDMVKYAPPELSIRNDWSIEC